ncbi:MAG: quinone-dependent dihydroorotate dehydrogenase [Candidatus Doudnabacteria bacterium CG10_big_fil_rev_8_21_14_0_10_42_18]|uniref:Dihydroorotate dehydrogenase (quinone) n=1 Tax=Candidatus Doudnabacteria bacterium CG10_big_fil_rev_8_21_14_0_10_42_18 TaxID=1974552 RepID=A0A2H0VDB9_9BACT|nr:MAG: quinone-dependent dihydroorotate dehydrogenase [Candidatus Doudnabacteria bacterium CG10_big_fil_rev_8_21_14_0_10_42_18]
MKGKTLILQFLYQSIIKRILFLFDPETVHNRMLNLGEFLGKFRVSKWMVKFCFYYYHPSLKQELLNLTFKNPVGLAAGFDKNGKLTQILPEVGFGFMEIGSVSDRSCSGNEKPRLWRLKKFMSLRVHYGLPSEGASAVAERLGSLPFSIPLGINIVKTNDAQTDSIEDGIKDYERAFKKFLPLTCYFTINISCPNTFGGEPFLEAENLDKLLSRIDALKGKQAVVVKLSPDLSESRLDALLKVIMRHKIDGIICSNLTKVRDAQNVRDKQVPGEGGFSGRLVEEASNELIKKVYRKTAGKITIIGCGGVFSAEDAYKKIKLGASLIQLVTGMIYEGPQLIGEINRGLAELTEKDGYKNISEAVGVNNILALTPSVS